MAKSKPAKSAPAPQHFFARQLAGEAPLSLETARGICLEAKRLDELQPWETLNEQQFLFFTGATGGEPNFCSIMGTRGEIFALAVYIGWKAYYTQQRIYEEPDLEVFLYEQQAIKVELVGRHELTKYDRELLTATGYPRQGPAPQLRTQRPGFYPWYITEPEAAVLEEGVAAFNNVFARPGALELWDRAGRYPIASLRTDGSGYEVGFIEPPPSPAEEPPPSPPLVPKRMANVSRLARRNATFEVSTFHGMPVGGPNERPAAARIGLAVDARSGMILHMNVYEPVIPAGNVLADTLLNAMEKAGGIPAKLHVSKVSHAQMLEAAANVLHCKLDVRPELPALDAAREGLFQHLFG